LGVRGEEGEGEGEVGVDGDDGVDVVEAHWTGRH
jgi:hypothetical protein